MARGYDKKANQKVAADKNERSTPAKKAIAGNDLRTKKTK